MLKIERVKNVPGDYENLLFCEKAISRDKSRLNLNTIKIDTGLAVTTDGHRLHLAELYLDYPDGIYRIICKDKNCFTLEEDKDFLWPDYEKAFPVHKNFKEIPMYKNSRGDKKQKSSLSNNYTRLVREMPKEITLNLRFLEDFLGEDFYMAFVYEEKNKPVCFQNSNKLVLVSPTKIIN